jgi:heterodisulfide reductase subunit C
MKNFGYSISKPRFIDFESNDKQVADFLNEHEPSFRKCIECGGCSATCTAGNFTSFSLRELHVLIRRGETARMYDVLKKCMLCGKCTLVCPRGVNTRNVIMLARQALQKSVNNAV